jgi:hypothetical protein|tara:strand:- start:129 stop:314 length:186 start_codon:yes stop_codon:yes gene_type:complete
MVPIWPFKKKRPKSRLKGNDFTENIVEYERLKDTKTDEKISDRSHLEDKEFLDALKVLDKK